LHVNEGFDYETMYLCETEIEKTSEIFDKSDADENKAIHYRRHYGEATKRILKIIGDYDDYYLVVLERWGEYLRNTLSFPFDAEVVENVDGGEPEIGDKVSVKKIEGFDILCNLLVSY
jgi:hypothetical protein